MQRVLLVPGSGGLNMDAIRLIEVIGRYCDSHSECSACGLYKKRRYCPRIYQLTKGDVAMLEAWEKGHRDVDEMTKEEKRMKDVWKSEMEE